MKQLTDLTSVADRDNSTWRSIEFVEKIEWIGYNNADMRCVAYQYSGQNGLNIHANNHNDPYEISKIFIRDELLVKIVNQTNLYAVKSKTNSSQDFKLGSQQTKMKYFSCLGYFFILLGIFGSQK